MILDCHLCFWKPKRSINAQSSIFIGMTAKTWIKRLQAFAKVFCFSKCEKAFPVPFSSNERGRALWSHTQQIVHDRRETLGALARLIWFGRAWLKRINLPKCGGFPFKTISIAQWCALEPLPDSFVVDGLSDDPGCFFSPSPR